MFSTNEALTNPEPYNLNENEFREEIQEIFVEMQNLLKAE